MMINHLNPCWAAFDDKETALLDSAASLTLVKTAAVGTVSATTHQPKLITIPNGTKMKTTAELSLAIPQLPLGACTAHLMPGLAQNLLALSQLCDNGCVFMFTKDSVEAKLNSEVVLRGWRDATSNLWRVPITQHTTEATHTVSSFLSCMLLLPSPRDVDPCNKQRLLQRVAPSHGQKCTPFHSEQTGYNNGTHASEQTGRKKHEKNQARETIQ